MDRMNEYTASTILDVVDRILQYRHGNVSVFLHRNTATFEQALLATAEQVRELPNSPLYGVTPDNPLNVIGTSSSNLPIRTSEKLRFEPMPEPVLGHRRAAFKAKFCGPENQIPPRDPYILQLRATFTEKRLALIRGSVVVSAADWDDGDPRVEMSDIPLLCDTGAYKTIITADMLSPGFVHYLHTDPINAPHRHHGNPRVQVGLLLEFSNSILSLETIATVFEREAVPKIRSGIILGQNGCINSMQYRSIPRAVLEAQVQIIGSEFWGDLVVESFVDLDGILQQL
ncbi:hypothetical protein N7495_007118 [Penicillium taxi]|uniref:uncharacterized protein n=1 Tax=Penicillium taxi TaxID=168475 RepID=UPI0025457B65|nr:uncharacterized protein N7495_007118 [Penicillium taxi]KAJ5895427.1 hypothetical protein N7495_007118 [Penicillium taxi]